MTAVKCSTAVSTSCFLFSGETVLSLWFLRTPPNKIKHPPDALDLKRALWWAFHRAVNDESRRPETTYSLERKVCNILLLRNPKLGINALGRTQTKVRGNAKQEKQLNRWALKITFITPFLPSPKNGKKLNWRAAPRALRAGCGRELKPRSKERRETRAKFVAPSLPSHSSGASHHDPPQSSMPLVPGPHPTCKLSPTPEPYSLPRGLTITAHGRRRRRAGWPAGESVTGARDPLAPTTSPAKWKEVEAAAPGDDVKRRAASSRARPEAGGRRSYVGPGAAPEAGRASARRNPDPPSDLRLRLLAAAGRSRSYEIDYLGRRADPPGYPSGRMHALLSSFKMFLLPAAVRCWF